MQEKKLLLLDAYALIFRAFYALIRNPRTTRSGLDTSATFGFVNMLQDLLKRECPSHVAVCFDPGGETFRHRAYSDYKANRDKTPEGILVAVPYIKRILEAYHIPVVIAPGYEADDVIGTLAGMAERQGFMTYMVTGDKDFAQLVTDRVKVYNPGKGEILGPEEVKQKYGLNDPAQVIDMLGLMGDSADNIPGCPGVGPKKAEMLIQQFGSVENLLSHTDQLKGALKKNVEDNREQIRFSKFLATIKTDVPIEWDEVSMRRRSVDMDALRQVFDELEFRTLSVRLIDQGEANVGLEVPATQPTPAADLALRSSDTKSPPQPGDQLSLFDLAAASPALATIDAHVISDSDEAARIIGRMAGATQVAVHAVIEGDDAMTATIRAIALCHAPGQVCYMLFDDKDSMLRTVAPLFASETRIVCDNVKRLMVTLAVAGIDWKAPYYDTAVAHYLLQPEGAHDAETIVADMQGHVMQHRLAAIAKAKLSPADRQVVDWACERAAVSYTLPDALNARLAEENLTHLLTDIELPLVSVLADMEITGARIDTMALHEYSLTLTERMHDLEEECCQLAGEQFNTASPMQVGAILFDKLKLDPKAKKTKTGQYSTTEEILLKLRDRHPLVGKILELRGIRKLLNTYVDALPRLINPATGRIHTTYNQTVTATGRLSSTNPNLQNIPVRTDEGREIRRAFIPADGNVFFSADYSQIELRLVADMSGDTTMLDAFAQGRDIHALTAARIYHEPLEQVTTDQRRKAKTANFGILYGISAFGLAERLDIPRAEAKQLIDGYFATFPGVRQYIDRSVEQARRQGYVTTLEGRRRMLPDINSRNAAVRSFSERNAVNAPIQGTAADIIKRAMVAIHRRFADEGICSRMILQVHDELNFDVVPSELDRVRDIVISEMENAYHGRVRLVASHAAADNWLDAH